MTPDYWNRQIKRWMDIFSDEEPDLIGLELVREFDNLTKKFYNMFDEDLIGLGGGSEFYLGLKNEIVREEVNVVLYDSSSGIRQRKVRPVSVPAKRLIENAPQSRIGEEQDTSEDIIVTDENIKVVSQLPINNKKENIKVVAHEDNTVTLSYLNHDGKRCTRTLDIPYDINFEMAKATYKNGIFEVAFGRK
jgi:HSP20 family molecular chaperone IbpA